MLPTWLAPQWVLLVFPEEATGELLCVLPTCCAPWCVCTVLPEEERVRWVSGKGQCPCCCPLTSLHTGFKRGASTHSQTTLSVP